MRRLISVLALCVVTASSPSFADGLPVEYQQLEFIQANGNCQIRTGITPACTDKVEMVWRPTTVSGNQNLFCSRTGTGGTGQFTLFMIGDKVRFDRNTSTVTGANAISADTKYTAVADFNTLAGTVTLADTGAEVTSVTMPSGEYTPGSELCLYASHTSDPNTGLNNYASHALYSFKLSDSAGDLKLDLVPAKREADGVIGLYDAVNDAFLTNSLSGAFLAGPAALTFNSYTWNGGASGNLSDAANWSPAPAGAFTADDELVVNDAAEITVDAAATVGKLTLNAAGAVAFTGANALTITRIANTGAGDVTFNCPVNFSGTYYVEQTGAVKFPGGATATYPDATLRTASALDRTLDGTFTFTEDWIVNNVDDYPWIVASNSVVRGKNFSGTQVSQHRILRVEETGYACFTTVTNGWDRGDIDIDGTLEATGEVIVRTNPSGGSTASRFGRSGNIGTVKAPRIAKCEHATASSLIPNLIVGAGGIGSVTQDYTWRFDVDTTITATDSFEFLGVYRSGNAHDWGLSLNGKTITIVVPENKTVTFGVGIAGTAGSIVKQGAGTLVMTDTFNEQSGFVKQYANGTVIEEGKVVFAANGQLGTGPVTLGANGTLEIADGISFANPIEGDGAISVAGDITMLDGARLLAGTSTFSAGSKVVVENQTTQGVIATGVSRADFDACFETSNGGLTWSDGSVSYGNSYVWVGAEGGNWSDAANWSWNGQTGTKAPLDDDYADVSFTNAATVVLDASATIQDLYFSGSGAVKIHNPAATHGFVTTNHLALASVSNSATVMPEIECKVDFAGTYKVAFTNKGVKFAGGAIATTWDSGNTLTTPTIDINGTVTFTAEWTVSTAVGHKCYVRNGATLNCATLTLPYCGNAYNQLNDIHVDNGGVLNCKTLTQNGRANNFNNVGNCVTLVSDTSGIINVTGTMTQNRGGRVGTWKCGGGVRAYMYGELNLNGLVVNNTTGNEWLSFEQKKANIGSGGIVVKSTDKFTKGIIFAPWVRLGAYADYEMSSEKSDPVMYLYQDLTFDTLDSVDGTTPRTIRVSANLHDEKTRNNDYQYGYNFAGGYIVKVNPGTLILSGDSTYSLGTTVNGGTVRLEHSNAAGTGAITVAAGATLELVAGVTITNSVTFADGATLVCGAGSQISGPVTRNGTVNLRLLGSATIFPSGYTDTTGFVVTPDSAVGTLSVEDGALKYDARAVGTYTWTGAVDGNFSTPGNWSVNDEAVNDVPGVLDTIRFAPEAAATVTLDADAQVAAMVIEGAGALTLANPSEATNTLTLASVTSSATVMPVINCKVKFTDKYTVSFTNTSVNFAGGATATTWDSANTAAVPTSEFYGNITFTEDWTVPSATGNKCYVKNGATLTCPTLILPYRGASYDQLALLQVDAGGTLNCRTVEQNGSTTYYNGVGNGVVVYVNGTLNVTEGYNMNNCGRIGIFKQQGNNKLQATGVFNVKGIVADSTTTSPKWIEQRKLNLGSEGIVVKATDVTGIGIGPQITLGALADYAIRYEGTGSKVHFHAPVTFDTYDSAAATARTVTISADVEDGKSIGTYSGGRYDVGGAIIKKNAGTLVVSGYNTFTGGTTVNGGTLLAAHDHALGTGPASVGAGGTLELMEGVSVMNLVTLAADATLLIDGTEARTAAGTSVVGTIATPSTGTANLKVVGDLSEETQNISILLGALAEGASVEALTLDATELTLPNAGWRARLKAREGAFMLDVKKPTGMTIIVR